MLIDLTTAKLHVVADDDSGNGLLTIYIGAAERFASEYLQRNIYADQPALTAAITAIPAAFAAANSAFIAAMALVEAMDAGEDRDMAEFAALDTLRKARQAARMTHQGIVINDAIKAAMLLCIGHLYANREDSVVGTTVAELPMGSRYLLDTLRAY